MIKKEFVENLKKRIKYLDRVSERLAFKIVRQNKQIINLKRRLEKYEQ